MQGQGYCDALLRLRAKNAAATDDIWKPFDRGEIPIDQARKNISTLRAELERLSGQDTILKLVLRNSARHTGKLADAYVGINWWGETPEEIDPNADGVKPGLRSGPLSFQGYFPSGCGGSDWAGLSAAFFGPR
jgi:hypothetical protein